MSTTPGVHQSRIFEIFISSPKEILYSEIKTVIQANQGPRSLTQDDLHVGSYQNDNGSFI